MSPPPLGPTGQKRKAQVTSDQKKTSSELLEDDDPLALVDSGEHDGDGSGCQAGPQRAGVPAEEVLGGALSRAGKKSREQFWLETYFSRFKLKP